MIEEGDFPHLTELVVREEKLTDPAAAAMVTGLAVKCSGVTVLGLADMGSNASTTQLMQR